MNIVFCLISTISPKATTKLLLFNLNLPDSVKFLLTSCVLAAVFNLLHKSNCKSATSYLSVVFLCHEKNDSAFIVLVQYSLGIIHERSLY